MKRVETIGVTIACCVLFFNGIFVPNSSAWADQAELSDSGEESVLNKESVRTAERQIGMIESIRISLDIHPELKAWHFELEKAENEKKIARSNFGPTLGVNYNHSELMNEDSKGPTNEDYLDQKINSTDLSLVQPVFNGFSSINEYRRSDLARQKVEWKIKDIELQIVQNVQSEFLKLLQFREEVKSLRETVKRLQTNLAATEAFYRVNMVPYVQVLQASVDLGDAVQRLSRSETSLKTQTVKLNVLLALPPDSPISYEGRLDIGLTKFSWELKECLAYALEKRPDLIVSQIGRLVAEKDVAIVKGRYYPTVQMEAHLISRDTNYDALGRTSSGTYDRDQENQYWQVGLSMRWNLFEGGKTYYSHQKYLNEVNRQQESIRLLEDDINAKVRAYYLTLHESWDRIGLTQKVITAANENYQMANKRYQLHLAPNQEVLDAQDRLYRAEANRNQALADYKLSLCNLYAAMGLRNDALQPEMIDASSLIQGDVERKE